MEANRELLWPLLRRRGEELPTVALCAVAAAADELVDPLVLPTLMAVDHDVVEDVPGVLRAVQGWAGEQVAEHNEGVLAVLAGGGQVAAQGAEDAGAVHGAQPAADLLPVNRDFHHHDVGLCGVVGERDGEVGGEAQTSSRWVSRRSSRFTAGERLLADTAGQAHKHHRPTGLPD